MWEQFVDAPIVAPGTVVVRDSSSKTILIVGVRGTVSGKPGIIVDGRTTGFTAGDKMKPFVKFPGQTTYSAGSARPEVSAVGDFTWQRKTGKKTYVYFTNEAGDVQSNRKVTKHSASFRRGPRYVTGESCHSL